VRNSLRPAVKDQFARRYDAQLQYKYGVRQGRLFSHYYVDLTDRGNFGSPDLANYLGDPYPYQILPWYAPQGPFLSKPLPEWLSIHNHPAQEAPDSRAHWECIAAGWPWRSVRAAWHFPQDAREPRIMEKGWAAGVGYRMAEPGASPDRGFVPTVYAPLALGASLGVFWLYMFIGVELCWLLVATCRYENGQCTRCGYAIDGLPPAGKCPECGGSLIPPWLLRTLWRYPRT